MQLPAQKLIKRIDKIELAARQLVEECLNTKTMLAAVSTAASTRKGNKKSVKEAALLIRMKAINKKTSAANAGK